MATQNSSTVFWRRHGMTQTGRVDTGYHMGLILTNHCAFQILVTAACQCSGLFFGDTLMITLLFFANTVLGVAVMAMMLMRVVAMVTMVATVWFFAVFTTRAASMLMLMMLMLQRTALIQLCVRTRQIAGLINKKN